MANPRPRQSGWIAHRAREQARWVRALTSALRRLRRQSAVVSFTNLADEMGVHRATLYRNPELYPRAADARRRWLERKGSAG